VRGYGGPCGQQHQSKNAANEPHGGRLNKVSAGATVEMGNVGEVRPAWLCLL
jgi:hypothetical protein